MNKYKKYIYVIMSILNKLTCEKIYDKLPGWLLMQETLYQSRLQLGI